MNDHIELARRVDEAFRAFGISLPPAVAGFVGALISLRYLPAMTGWQAWATLGVGFAAAGYLSPVVTHYVSWPPGSVGLLIGLAAMSVVGGLMALLNDWRSNPAEFIRQWWPWARNNRGGDK